MLSNRERCQQFTELVKPTFPASVRGETDEFSYNITRDPVHVRDFQATILPLFGIDHEKFSYK